MTHVIHSPSFGNVDLLHEINVKISKLECPSLHFASRMAFLPYFASNPSPNVNGAGAVALDAAMGAGVVGIPDISSHPSPEGIADIMLECAPMPAQLTGTASPTSPASAPSLEGGRQPATRRPKTISASSAIVVYDRFNFWPDSESDSKKGSGDLERAVNVVQPVLLDLQPPASNKNSSQLAGSATASSEPSPDLYVWYSPNTTITSIAIGANSSHSYPPSSIPQAAWSLRQDMDPIGLRILGVHFVREPGSGSGPTNSIRALQLLVHAPPLRPIVRDPNEKVMVTTSSSASLSNGKVMSPYGAMWIGGGVIAAVIVAVVSVLGLVRNRRRRREKHGKWTVLEDREAVWVTGETQSDQGERRDESIILGASPV